MTRTTPTRRRTTAKTAAPISPRALLLAGLGAASLCRRQALDSIDGLAEGAEGLRQRANAVVREASSRAAKFRNQAQAEFESRFAPLLVKLGAAPARAKRPVRSAKRSVRPTAKRARKRA